MRIVYLTAGAAGMYCGSCLHDNALAKALIKLGHDAMLVPTYTPILTDEASVSTDQLFYGGLNVYLQQVSPVFRWIPRWADRFLSSPRLVGWIASRAMGTSAKNLGAMTVSMLQGTDGNQSKEVLRLCEWLKEQQPDVLLFSNLLIAGCIPEIKRQLGCPTAVILQGDDIFYESLEEPFKQQAVSELRRLAKDVDRFIVHSQDYGTRMQALLQFDPQRLSINPLSIDVGDFIESEAEQPAPERPPTLGYLARLAPEKGLDYLVRAFLDLKQELPEARLEIAGWLGPQHEAYWAEQKQRLAAAGFEADYAYHGSVDRAGKLQFLKSIDVLSVPTPYQEPKGLFVLEALAAGIPYVQPAHGAFPELHARLGGGQLFAPEDSAAHARQLLKLLSDRNRSRALGAQGREKLLASATTLHEAEKLLDILQQTLRGGR